MENPKPSQQGTKAEKVHEKKEKRIKNFTTSHGSIYTYLPDGRTQRYQKATETEHKPQDIILFIPDFKTLQKIAPKELIESGIFGQTEREYLDIILDYVHNPDKTIAILNESYKELTNMAEIQKAKQIFLALASNSGQKVDTLVLVSKKPRIGFVVYDKRYYKEDEKEKKDGYEFSHHVGHKIIEISEE